MTLRSFGTEYCGMMMPLLDVRDDRMRTVIAAMTTPTTATSCPMESARYQAGGSVNAICSSSGVNSVGMPCTKVSGAKPTLTVRVSRGPRSSTLAVNTELPSLSVPSVTSQAESLPATPEAQPVSPESESVSSGDTLTVAETRPKGWSWPMPLTSW